MSDPDTADALHVQAQRALLDGLRRGDALSELERAVRHSQTRQFTPDIAILQVGVAALTSPRSIAAGRSPKPSWSSST